MSLFKRAGDLIRAMIQGSEEKLRPEIDAVTGDLDFAHRAHTQALGEGVGRHITIDGAGDTGFLVSLHNGTLFRSYSIEAGDEFEALKDAVSKFDEEVESNPVPQSAVASPEPVAPEDDEPAGPGHPVERPFDSDPGTLDVTRGRVGDELPDPIKVRDESVPPGVTESAAPLGTHDGNEQAVSYEADPVEAGAEVQSSEMTLGEHLALAEQRAAEHGGEPDAGETHRTED